MIKRVLTLLFFLGALVLAYFCYQTYQESSAGVSILGFDFSIKDQETQQMAIYYGIGAVVSLLISGWMARR